MTDTVIPVPAAERRRRAELEELVQRLRGVAPEDGLVDPLPGVQVRRASAPTELHPGVSRPSLCVIAQGSKEILLGAESFVYDAAHYLVATIELPITSRILEAAPERPYLSVLLDLDARMVGSVLVEAGELLPRTPKALRALDVSALDVDLLDAVLRIVRLIGSPDAPFLLALLQREITYRLLVGEQRERLGQVALLSGPASPIAIAVERLRTGFREPLRMDDLARDLGISVSGFHHHFKSITGTSPLQFQKQLRLQAARQLMVGDRLDAASAGRRVGYDDPAHFTRDYKRLFGAPPARDTRALRGTLPDSGI